MVRQFWLDEAACLGYCSIMSSGVKDAESTTELSVDDISASVEENRHGPVKAALVCIAGRMSGTSFQVDTSECVLGRVEKCQIRIDDTGISRTHAKIVVDGDTYTLSDFGSTNGTMCNGVPVIQPVQLKHGDRIQVGPKALFRFELRGELEANMQSHLYDLVTRDALTKAYNRRFFMDRLKSEWAWAKRHERACVLLMLDVDHFKRVNDTYGHAAGDMVLRELARLMEKAIRIEDVFARIGGEEFCFLARDTEKTTGMVVAERFRQMIESHAFAFNEERIPVTVSIGVAVSTDDKISSSDELLAKADEWLYQAKKLGRNRVESAACAITGPPSSKHLSA